MAVWKALNYLLKESHPNKGANIQVDTSSLDNICNLSDDDKELVTESRHNDSDCHVESKDEENDDLNQMHSPEGETCWHRLDEDEYDQKEMSDDEGITFAEENEDNLVSCAIDMDTMLDDYYPIIPQPDEPLVPDELAFAPGESQVPLSVFQDENAEYLAFPTIYCGEKRPDNSERVHKVHYSDICKYKLRCADR